MTAGTGPAATAGSGRAATRVLLVDDQALLRTGFRLILESEPDLEVAGESADGLDAVEAARRLAPDVVLMDIRMPRMDGVEATRLIVAAGSAKVLILTTFDLDEYVFDALRAGASGFLLKDTPAEDLVTAVRVVAGGDALLSPSVTRRLIEEFARQPVGQTAQPQALASLTARELEVLKLMARGMTNGEIARDLVVSETTVKTHVGRVLDKLSLRDRVQAVVFAYETALIRPGAPG
jgi:DNA-binding NarL/FixJ family response regulator